MFSSCFSLKIFFTFDEKIMQLPATINVCGRDVFLSRECFKLPASSPKHLKHIFLEALWNPSKKLRILCVDWWKKTLLVFVAVLFFSNSIFFENLFSVEGNIWARFEDGRKREQCKQLSVYDYWLEGCTSTFFPRNVRFHVLFFFLLTTFPPIQPQARKKANNFWGKKF